MPLVSLVHNSEQPTYSTDSVSLLLLVKRPTSRTPLVSLVHNNEQPTESIDSVSLLLLIKRPTSRMPLVSLNTLG